MEQHQLPVATNGTNSTGPPDYNPGNTGFVLASTALVWLMIPGVGYFYSGMARSKSALSLLMLSCWSCAVVSVQVNQFVGIVLIWEVFVYFAPNN
jgi:ammonia channel protein AmtB